MAVDCHLESLCAPRFLSGRADCEKGFRLLAVKALPRPSVFRLFAVRREFANNRVNNYSIIGYYC